MLTGLGPLYALLALHPTKMWIEDARTLFTLKNFNWELIMVLLLNFGANVAH